MTPKAKPKKQTKQSVDEIVEARYVLGECIASARGNLDGYRRGSRAMKPGSGVNLDRVAYAAFSREAHELMTRLKRRHYAITKVRS